MSASRLAGVGRNTFPPEKWQDILTERHCAVRACGFRARMWCSTVHLSSAWQSQHPERRREAMGSRLPRPRVPQAWSAYLGSPDVFDGFGSLALRFLTISWASFLDVLRPFRKNFILPQPVQCGQMCCWVPRFLHSTYPCTSPSA